MEYINKLNLQRNVIDFRLININFLPLDTINGET